MESQRFCFCFLILCTSNILLIPNGGLAKICSPNKHDALFIFGDSLFDAGNNNYINTSSNNQANYAPYGENFFKYPSGRFSDGRIIPDFIGKNTRCTCMSLILTHMPLTIWEILLHAAEYAKLPLIQPFMFPGNHEYINGANFASGGSGALVETQQGLVC